MKTIKIFFERVITLLIVNISPASAFDQGVHERAITRPALQFLKSTVVIQLEKKLLIILTDFSLGIHSGILMTACSKKVSKRSMKHTKMHDTSPKPEPL